MERDYGGDLKVLVVSSRVKSGLIKTDVRALNIQSLSSLTMVLMLTLQIPIVSESDVNCLRVDASGLKGRCQWSQRQMSQISEARC